MKRSRQHAFTLLELLVALSVFAVLAVLAWGGLRDTLRRDDVLRAHLDDARRIEFALLLLEQDLHHAVGRGVRDELGDPEPALRAGIDGDLLSVTRQTVALPSAEARSDLLRIRYRVEDGVLYRDVWQQLDRVPGTGFRTRRLLDGVSDFELRFFGDDAWTGFWPGDDSEARRDTLPRGAEITIGFGAGRSLRRVLAFAG